MVIADPITSCKALNNGKSFWGNIVIVERGDCMFVGKLPLTTTCLKENSLKITRWAKKKFDIFFRSNFAAFEKKNVFTAVLDSEHFALSLFSSELIFFKPTTTFLNLFELAKNSFVKGSFASRQSVKKTKTRQHVYKYFQRYFKIWRYNKFYTPPVQNHIFQGLFKSNFTNSLYVLLLDF